MTPVRASPIPVACVIWSSEACTCGVADVHMEVTLSTSWSGLKRMRHVLLVADISVNMIDRLSSNKYTKQVIKSAVISLSHFFV